MSPYMILLSKHFSLLKHLINFSGDDSSERKHKTFNQKHKNISLGWKFIVEK